MAVKDVGDVDARRLSNTKLVVRTAFTVLDPWPVAVTPPTVMVAEAVFCTEPALILACVTV